MNGKHWRKAGAAAALSLALAAQSEAFQFYGPEPVSVAPAVEYYNAELGEYFLTTSVDELVTLDAKLIPGWVRTKSVAFYTVDTSAAVYVDDGWLQSALPVCRFFIPPASHLLSLVPDECAALGEGSYGAVLETDAAFYAWSPDAQGRCPQVTAEVLFVQFDPVYRLWDARKGLAHRLTTSKAERDAMVAEGWVSEGYGDDGVAMCVPPSGS
jgi:Repeat of unknown function (DUF5648)